MSLAKEASSQSKSKQRRERRKRSYEKLASWQQDLHHVKKRLSKEASYAEQAAVNPSKAATKPSSAGDVYRGGK